MAEEEAESGAAAEEATPEERPRIHAASYALHYIVLFFAHWFGSARFDPDGDRDFDPQDVRKYLAERGHIRRNFKQSATLRRKRRRQAPQAVQEGGGAVEDQIGEHQGSGGAGDLGDPQDLGDTAEPRTSVVIPEWMSSYGLEGQLVPWFIVTESAACILLWLIMAIQLSPEFWYNMKAGLDTFADGQTDLRLSTNCEDQRFQAWRWFTYQWTHIGWTHPTMNALMNLMLGIPLEGLHGGFRMAIMFNIGVFGGACCHFINDAHSSVVGCSGGGYALVGMHFADLAINWGQNKFRWATLAMVVWLVTADVVTYTMSLGPENVSHSAHVGGFVAGIIICALVGKNLKVKSWEQIFRLVLATFGGSLVTFCITWLSMHKAPLNIWESAREEQGYCWWRQVFVPAIDPSTWLCVRCGTPACIEEWTVEWMETVSRNWCEGFGWHNDGR